ncbi:MAG: citrate lyase acyl carrier protein [Bacilli bacterium]|nr:citrate lyase acyl carrier protein [Bacilli bacterium]
MKIGICGSMESNDCIITVKENYTQTNEIKINSIVRDFFYDQIYDVIEKTLKENNIQNVIVECNDKGALDFTIKARLLCAINRYRGE